MSTVEESSERRIRALRLDRISDLHTLGPPGTNLEAAAYEWFRRAGRHGGVHLHRTLEEALPKIQTGGTCALVACAVYPALHTLVFDNLDRLEMVDSFVFPTFRMVLASRDDREITTVSAHPAPRGLVGAGPVVRLSTSNAEAASECAAGLVDACVTTSAAAESHGLRIRDDFGAVSMVYTIHLVL